MKLSSQFGSVCVCVQSFHLSSGVGAEEGVVLIQVGGDELWEISLQDYLQEHVCCCV